MTNKKGFVKELKDTLKKNGNILENFIKSRIVPLVIILLTSLLLLIFNWYFWLPDISGDDDAYFGLLNSLIQGFTALLAMIIALVGFIIKKSNKDKLKEYYVPIIILIALLISIDILGMGLYYIMPNIFLWIIFLVSILIALWTLVEIYLAQLFRFVTK